MAAAPCSRRPDPATRLRDAREAVAACERVIDEITLALHRGHTGLSKVGVDDDAVIREARERLFSCRRRLDDIRLELLTPEHPSLNPNDEDDMATALHLRLRANEEAEARECGELDFIEQGRREMRLQIEGAAVMSSAAQAATAATLAMLNAPTPWHPRDENARVLMDALGRPRFLILPVDDGDAATDAALARAVSRVINKEAGAELEAAEQVDLRPGRPVFGRRVALAGE